MPGVVEGTLDVAIHHPWGVATLAIMALVADDPADDGARAPSRVGRAVLPASLEAYAADLLAAGPEECTSSLNDDPARVELARRASFSGSAPVLDHRRTVIVTGSSSGIGLDIARAFVDRDANVVLNGRDAARLAAAAGALGRPDRVAHVAGNIADRATGEALVREAVERFGAVDVLVNNAGTFGLRPFLDVTEAELEGYLTGNLKGTFLTTQAAVRQMKRQGRGAIVNIGTVLVEHAIGAVPASAPLASKGGVHALTVSLAAELAVHGIRVNAVAPGMVRTRIHGQADWALLARAALLDRVGEVDETTAAVLYLAEAAFTTGHILRVDGGFVTGRNGIS